MNSNNMDMTAEDESKHIRSGNLKNSVAILSVP